MSRANIKLKNQIMTLFITLFLGGCGNLTNPSGITAPSSYATVGTDSTPQQNTNPDLNPSNYLCPSSPNIIPMSSEINANHFNYYKLCPNKNSTAASQFLLSQTSLNPSVNSSVCVFPAMEQALVTNVPSPGISVTPIMTNGTSHTPLVRCVNLAQTAAWISFPATGSATQWNAVYIVPETAGAEMTRCLKNPSIPCPAYSFGTF